MKHITEPRHCAACYGQYEGGGIDFEAAFDGPMLSAEIAAGQHMHIDDLYICARCLASAAKMLEPPLINAPDLLAEKAGLEARIAELEEYDRRNVKAISDLNAANAALTTRAGGKPGPVVPHAREVAGESERLKREREEHAGPIPAAA